MVKLFEEIYRKSLKEMGAHCRVCGKTFDSHDGGYSLAGGDICEPCLSELLGKMSEAAEHGDFERDLEIQEEYGLDEDDWLALVDEFQGQYIDREGF